MADTLYIGIDMGGTNTKAGLFDGELRLIDRGTRPTPVDAGPEAVVDQIGGLAEELLKKQGLSMSHVAAVGIVSPGLIDIEAGIVRATSNIRFTNVPLRRMVRDRLGKPALLENDANVTCWAEHVAGAGRGVKNMVLITLGTGVGGGVLCNGELVHGFDDNAGEIGHTILHPGGRLCGCGQRGCVEAYASASATARRAKEAIEYGMPSSLAEILEANCGLTGKDVFDHAGKGDALACTIVDETAEALAMMSVNLLHLTGPERIVFFGGMIAAGDLLLNPIREHFRKRIWTIKQERVMLCFAELGDDAGIIGTASLVIHACQRGTIPRDV